MKIDGRCSPPSPPLPPTFKRNVYDSRFRRVLMSADFSCTRYANGINVIRYYHLRFLDNISGNVFLVFWNYFPINGYFSKTVPPPLPPPSSLSHPVVGLKMKKITVKAGYDVVKRSNNTLHVCIIYIIFISFLRISNRFLIFRWNFFRKKSTGCERALIYFAVTRYFSDRWKFKNPCWSSRLRTGVFSNFNSLSNYKWRVRVYSRIPTV